ncbi:MAG: adenosylcobinamide-GDP ribazoletransferase [Lachnospiraceae bacterium]|nr:adenosylcobinamide-GDP ribazoletransferase [Candidatus Colinaster equi]
MKSIGRSFLMAFSGYSISPKTKLERSKENCSFVLIFIPLIGAIIGTIINRWAVAYPYLCNYLVLPAVVGAVIPSILSGGAHLDGFFRTTDALSSHKSREEKIHILKEDAHGGYSAIIVCICYFMVAIGVWSELQPDEIFVIAFGYIISRSLAGIALLSGKPAAEGKGMLYVPDKKSQKIVQVLILVAYIGISAFLMIEINVSVGVACLVGAALSYIYYLIMTYKNFGGVMEETANFFINVCEVVIPIAALIATKSWL